MHEELIQQTAQKHGVDATLLQALMAHEEKKVLLLKRRGIVEQLRKMIEEHLEKRAGT